MLVTGPADGLPLVFHHGTPQAAVPFGILERPATERGLRTVAYSRPGYGRSTPRPDAATTATVADDASDTAVVLDALGLDTFVTLGWSGGGPRASRAPPSCPAAASPRRRGWASPSDADGLDQTAGMGPENVAEYAAVAAGPEALTAFLEEHGAPMFTASADDIAQELGGLLPPVDRAAMTGELADYWRPRPARRRAGHRGLARRRPDAHPSVGLRPRRDRGPDRRVAGHRGPHGALRPRPVARGPRRGRPRPPRRGEGHVSLLMRMGDVLDDLLALARG